jgi:hypothetical protein
MCVSWTCLLSFRGIRGSSSFLALTQRFLFAGLTAVPSIVVKKVPAGLDYTVRRLSLSCPSGPETCLPVFAVLSCLCVVSCRLSHSESSLSCNRNVACIWIVPSWSSRKCRLALARWIDSRPACHSHNRSLVSLLICLSHRLHACACAVIPTDA